MSYVCFVKGLLCLVLICLGSVIVTLFDILGNKKCEVGEDYRLMECIKKYSVSAFLTLCH